MKARMPTTLDSELLRTFVVVANSGNVTRAAEQLGRTQSAISIQIKKLEETLGESIFQRGSRGVTLTTHGKKLMVNATKIIGLLDDTVATLRCTPLHGPVRIGIPEEYGDTILPRALAAFSNRHPEVEVTVKCGYSVEQLAAISSDELDIAVVFEPGHPAKGEILYVDPTVWVTSEAHGVHHNSVVPVALYGKSSWCKTSALGSLEQNNIDYRIAYTCDTSGGLVIAVVSGLAIAPLARSKIPVNCRALDENDGFPVIDSTNVVLVRNPRTANIASNAMSDVIRTAFSQSTTDWT